MDLGLIHQNNTNNIIMNTHAVSCTLSSHLPVASHDGLPHIQLGSTSSTWSIAIIDGAEGVRSSAKGRRGQEGNIDI